MESLTLFECNAIRKKLMRVRIKFTVLIIYANPGYEGGNLEWRFRPQ